MVRSEGARGQGDVEEMLPANNSQKTDSASAQKTPTSVTGFERRPCCQTLTERVLQTKTLKTWLATIMAYQAATASV